MAEFVERKLQLAAVALAKEVNYAQAAQNRDLTKVGRVFRAGIDVLRFDRFDIETVIRDRITYRSAPRN